MRNLRVSRQHSRHWLEKGRLDDRENGRDCSGLLFGASPYVKNAVVEQTEYAVTRNSFDGEILRAKPMVLWTIETLANRSNGLESSSDWKAPSKRDASLVRGEVRSLVWWILEYCFTRKTNVRREFLTASYDSG